MESGLSTWEDFFPYTPRPLQRNMLNFISKILKPRVHQVIEAANGTGKTITALASLLPYAKRYDKKIIYLARTHSQMDRVVEELQEISKQTKVNGIALRGKGNMCLNNLVNKYATNNRAVNEMCSQLKKAKRCEYWVNMENTTRVNLVMRELISRPVTAEIVLDMARDQALCPAEISRDALHLMDVIACSYLYLFDPDIRMSFLTSIDAELSDLIVVIDECHNLPEAVINITSDEVSTFNFRGAIREARNSSRYDFVQFFDALTTQLEEDMKSIKLYEEISIDPGEFLDAVYTRLSNVYTDDEFFEEMITAGSKIRMGLAKQGKEPRSSLGRLGEFFYNWYESIGKSSFTHSIEKRRFQNSSDEYVTLRLNSLDPSIAILPVLRYVEASLSISGSIGDPDAYAKITGIGELKMVSNILPSPYEKSNIETLVVKGLSTKYNQRSPQMWSRMVESIAAVANNTPANVGLFAPSYKILESIMNAGLRNHVGKEVVYVKAGMSSKENDKLVSRFKRMAQEDGGMLVSVLGGRSSEGADFPGELMQSVIVVGIPYAPVNVRVDAQIKYLDEKFPGMGWELAYQIPAINRASQAAGRPVRGLNDHAFILLADERFAWKKVKDHLPGWLRDSITETDFDPDRIGASTQKFFRKV